MELDSIDIHGLAFDSVIGAYPSERVIDQRVLLDVSLGLDTRPAALGNLGRTVDYARLIGELEFLTHACRFQLLETAAEALCRYMLAPPLGVEQRAQVERVSVKLGKPAVFASLRVTRCADEYHVASVAHAFGTQETLFETKDLGIYRLCLAPGRAFTAIWPEAHVLVLGGDPRVQDQLMPAGAAVAVPGAAVVSFRTVAEAAAVVVARPRLALNNEPGLAPLTRLDPAFAYYPAEHALPHAT